jgi:hypothetical protein
MHAPKKCASLKHGTMNVTLGEFSCDSGSVRAVFIFMGLVTKLER